MPSLVPTAVLEEIRVANDIAAVIGSYFHLQRSGSTYKALCPFHKEKTPSFMVNPQRQIFHCFGCGAGGDVFRFVMDYEKVDFMTAVKMLAAKANIRLTFEKTADENRMSKDLLYEIMTGAAGFYHQLLMSAPEAEIARQYLASRDLHRDTAEEFMIGYAPDRFDAIIAWAGKKYQRAQLEAAGLVINSSNAPGRGDDAHGPGGRSYDRFRNRLMFPIHDEQGRVVGFSGRILSEQAQSAKYVNTPETILFHKGRILYALNKARRAIVERHEAIVCEGQIDVIRCHLAGFNAAVAAQGTAFTDDHARILKRYADGVILVFDADAAGQKATIRAAETFLRAGLGVRSGVLPEGADPDTLLRRKDGTALFREILDKAQSVVDFQIDVLAKETKPDNEAALIRINSAVLGTIAQAANAVQRAGMLRRAAERLGVPEFTLSRELSRLEKRGRNITAAEPLPADGKPPAKEAALVEHLLLEPNLAALTRKYLPLEFMENGLCRQIVAACMEAEQTGRDIMSLLAEKDDQDRHLTAMAASALGAPAKIKSDFSTHEESVQLLILALRREAIQKQRREIEIKLQAARLSPKTQRADADITKLEIEYSQLGYDLLKMRAWNTALPVMELG